MAHSLFTSHFFLFFGGGGKALFFSFPKNREFETEYSFLKIFFAKWQTFATTKKSLLPSQVFFKDFLGSQIGYYRYTDFKKW